MDEASLVKARLLELESVASKRDIPKNTDFLGLSEQSIFASMQRSGELRMGILWGGYEDAERRIAFWPASYSSEPDKNEPLACIKIRPLNAKFSGELSHRDYLGSLMNLGVERSCLGDIVLCESCAYVYCMSDIAPFVAENLTRVKHTSVIAELAGPCEELPKPKTKELRVNVASERIDVLIAAIYRLSRSEALSLVEGEKVFAEGFAVKSCAEKLQPGMRVSVRGYGRFVYGGIDGQSRKGRLYARVQLFV